MKRLKFINFSNFRVLSAFLWFQWQLKALSNYFIFILLTQASLRSYFIVASEILGKLEKIIKMTFSIVGSFIWCVHASF